MTVTADSGKARDFILLMRFASRESNGPKEASDGFSPTRIFISLIWRVQDQPRCSILARSHFSALTCSSCARRVLQYFVKMKSACCRKKGHSCGVGKDKGFYERPFALHPPFQQNFVSAIHCTLLVLNAHQPINAEMQRL